MSGGPTPPTTGSNTVCMRWAIVAGPGYGVRESRLKRRKDSQSLVVDLIRTIPKGYKVVEG